MADQGDPLAGRALDKMAMQLARGVQMIVGAFDPETITFVGEFTAAWERFEPRIKAAVEQQKIRPAPVSLVPARDGELTRLRGSVALVLYKYFGVGLPQTVSGQ
jgi:predicted NBD/HSP70 family sugar kinase